MRIEINVSKDLKKLNRDLKQMKAKQLPHATAKALNQIALEARPVMQKAFEKDLNIKKKAMLRKAIQVQFANKRDFPYAHSIVGVIDTFGFLVDHVEGMQRKSMGPHGKAIPQEVKRASSGAIPKSQRPGVLLRRKGIFTFVGNSGRELIAKRDESEASGIKILYAFSPSVKIDKVVEIESGLISFANSNFDKILGEQLARAIKSAK